MQSLSALSEITGAKENSEGEPQDNSGEGLQHDGGNQSEKDSEYTSIEETFFHGILITFHTCHSLPIDCFSSSCLYYTTDKDESRYTLSEKCKIYLTISRCSLGPSKQ